jgi:hypothetical protein
MKRENAMKLWLPLLVAFVFAGCGVQSYVEKDPSVDLGKYRTYAWISESKGKDKDEKPYKDFQDTYLQELISKELEKSGFVRAKGTPDVLIDYDVMIENEVRERSESVYSRPFVRYFFNPYTGRVNSFYYPSRYMGQNSYDVPYKSGTVTVNIVDNDSQKLVWQGWAETEVTRKRIEKQEMEKIVRSIFRKLDVAVR